MFVMSFGDNLQGLGSKTVDLTLIFFCSPFLLTFICEGCVGLSSQGGASHVPGSVVAASYLSEKGEHVEFPSYAWPEFQIICYNGTPLSLLKLWYSAHMRIKMEGDDYQIFSGKNASHVQSQYELQKTAWIYSPFRMTKKEINLSPFESMCVGISTSQSFKVTLDLLNINLWMVCLTILGIALFLYSPQLCRNVFFHYTTGVTLGVLFSFFILTYILQRKLRSSFYSWILGFYSLSLYFVSSLWFNIRDAFLHDGQTYVFFYIIATSLISFGVCYRLGPVKDERTVNLIQWSMQGFALLLVFCGTYHHYASLAIMASLMGYMCIPKSNVARAKNWCKTHFNKPPPLRLLTESEYLDQSRVETAKALNDLRDYCNSPVCDAWKLIGRIKSPERFSEFVKGSSHITENEIIDYSQNEDDSLLLAANGESGDENGLIDSDSSQNEEGVMTDDEGQELPERTSNRMLLDNKNLSSSLYQRKNVNGSSPFNSFSLGGNSRVSGATCNGGGEALWQQQQPRSASQITNGFH